MTTSSTALKRPRTLIYNLLDLPHGHLAVTDIQVAHWGSTLIVDCTHTYPPDTKAFTLIFKDCQGIRWYVQNAADTAPDDTPAQLLTHDLGKPKHQHTARLATTMVEIILSYGELEIVKDW